MAIPAGCVWDDVFEKGEINYPDTNGGRGAAIATGLTGWANCMAGNKPPENFGKGMIELGKFLGISPQPNEFMKASKEWKSL